MMIADPEAQTWAPLADLYGLGQEVHAAVGTMRAQEQYVADVALGGGVLTPNELAHADANLARIAASFTHSIAQGRRWQASDALSPYQQAVLRRLLHDAALGLEIALRSRAFLPQVAPPGTTLSQRVVAWQREEQ
ncbi:MAG TPA: hypothetical protein VGE07_23270 [Herpetosiphonaceae bacterium]